MKQGACAGFAAGAIEDSEKEGGLIVEEFAFAEGA